MATKKKISRNTSPISNKIVFVAITALFLLAAYSVLSLSQKWWPFSAAKSSYTAPGTGTNSPSNKPVINKGDEKASDISPSTSQDIPVNPSVVASITQLDQPGDEVRFTAKVEGAAANGTCVVTFTNPADRPVTQEFSPTYSQSTATCGPIKIPAVEFTALGEWKVSFHYYAGSQQATAEGKVTIK